MKRSYLVIPIMFLGSQCMAGSSWESIGIEDGTKGIEMQNVAAISDVSEADTLAYLKGYQQGLEHFCQTDKAVTMATTGEQYQGVCKYTTHSWAFQKAYDEASVELRREEMIKHWVELANRNWR